MKYERHLIKHILGHSISTWPHNQEAKEKLLDVMVSHCVTVTSVFFSKLIDFRSPFTHFWKNGRI